MSDLERKLKQEGMITEEPGIGERKKDPSSGRNANGAGFDPAKAGWHR